MKQTTAAVISLVNAARAAQDSPIAFAECFTFITTAGSQYTWTNVDYDITYNGFVFSAYGPLVSGLKYKGSVGLEVDKQQIGIAARPTDVINGAPFLIALRDGAFDGAPVYRDRVFLTAPNGAVVGGVRMFQGRISTVDHVGRTQATLTVASDLVILDYDMPKNLFSPTCLHVLYDAGCGVIRGTFSISGTVAARFELEHGQLLRRSRGRRARIDRLLFRGERQHPRDGPQRERGRLLFADVSAALRTLSGGRVHRRLWLRPHPSHLSGQIQQPRRTFAGSLMCRRHSWPIEGVRCLARTVFILQAFFFSARRRLKCR